MCAPSAASPSRRSSDSVLTSLDTPVRNRSRVAAAAPRSPTAAGSPSTCVRSTPLTPSTGVLPVEKPPTGSTTSGYTCAPTEIQSSQTWPPNSWRFLPAPESIWTSVKNVQQNRNPSSPLHWPMSRIQFPPHQFPLSASSRTSRMLWRIIVECRGMVLLWPGELVAVVRWICFMTAVRTFNTASALWRSPQPITYHRQTWQPRLRSPTSTSSTNLDWRPSQSVTILSLCVSILAPYRAVDFHSLQFWCDGWVNKNNIRPVKTFHAREKPRCSSLLWKTRGGDPGLNWSHLQHNRPVKWQK